MRGGDCVGVTGVLRDLCSTLLGQGGALLLPNASQP